MLNHLVGNRDIEPPRRITPTGIPRDDANARLPIDTGMARGQQINGCGHLAIILEPMLSDVEAMPLNRPPRTMLPGQGMQRMHHAAIHAPDAQNTQRPSFSEESERASCRRKCVPVRVDMCLCRFMKQKQKQTY